MSALLKSPGAQENPTTTAPAWSLCLSVEHLPASCFLSAQTCPAGVEMKL